MSISKIKESARAALAGKWGKGIGMLFAYLGFSFVIGFITGLVGEETILGVILQLVTLLIEIPIAFGICYAYIKLKRNEEVGAFDFLNLGFSNFGRAWKIGLRTALKLILPFLGMVIGLVLVVYTNVISMANSIVESTTAEPSIGLIFAGVVVYIASGIWLIVRSLKYSLTTYIAYDNQNMNSLEVVNESARMMDGNRGKLFLLQLSFALWFLIPVVLVLKELVIPGVLVLLDLYVWLFPYMQVAYVCFYDNLLGKNVNNNTINNPENNAEAITEM